MTGNHADAVVVGGGFYGACIALLLRRHLPRVVLLEREAALLTRASRINQARLHNGYHYPRSFLTAARSHSNLDRFRRDFPEAVVSDFTHLYALARRDSKVGHRHFERLYATIGAPLRPVSGSVRQMFAAGLVDAVYEVDEPAFDVCALRRILSGRLLAAGVDVRLANDVYAVHPAPGVPARVVTGDGVMTADWVFNCTYSALNRIVTGSAEVRPVLEHQLAEVALVVPPPALEGLAITVMDGPFFSLMPFPSESLTSLTHVRYTPHRRWREGEGEPPDRSAPPPSRFGWMLRDAQRFVPALAETRHVHSLFETKTFAPDTQGDDARPILLHRDPRNGQVVSILGGKLDNIFDVLDLVESALGARSMAA